MKQAAIVRSAVLLRGINVGGHHSVPMTALRTVFEEQLGCTSVATYIQSGNVVCTAPATLDAVGIAHAIEVRFGFAVPVILRTQAELDRALTANPFATVQGAESGALHVVFLDAPMEKATLSALEARRSGEEQLAASGRELFLSLPSGFGRSKLAAACTAASMPGSPTVRNWKTVLALQAMLQG